MLQSLLASSVFRGSGHLKSDNSQIMGRSFLYDTLRGVKFDWSYWRCSPYPLLNCLRWLAVLGFLTTSFLTGWLVTKICEWLRGHRL